MCIRDRYALETEGYETNHATGIKDAGSLIEHYNFDLAIIDMQQRSITILRKNALNNKVGRRTDKRQHTAKAAGKG